MMRIKFKPEDRVTAPQCWVPCSGRPEMFLLRVDREVGFLPDSGWPGLPASHVFLCKLAPGLSHT